MLDENGEVVDLRNDGDEDEDDNRYPAETFEMNYSNDDAELEKSGYGIIDEEDLKENGSDDDDFSDDGFSDGEPIDFGEDNDAVILHGLSPVSDFDIHACRQAAALRRCRGLRRLPR